MVVAGTELRAQVTFTVNDTADAVDETPGDAVCETGLGNGICTLRAAVQEANALAGGPPGHTINVPAGTYTLAVVGQGEDAAATGDLDITRTDTTINGAGASLTIIDGGGIDRVFEARTCCFKNYYINGLTIQNGNPGVGNNGGGILNNASRMYLTDVTISSNTAANGGGIDSPTSFLNLTNVTISGNTATNDGGGIRNGGVLPDMALTNVTISGNTAANNGGGIAHAAGTANLTNVTLSGNSAPAAGGIYQQGGTTALTNTIIANSMSGGNCNGTITDSGNNLADDATCGTIPSTLTGLDPTLADNGGPTLTHKLLAGSNALDTGSNPSCPATDQRGFARPFNVVCDIGAYEESNYDVVIDGDFSEWDNGAGNEFCIDDQGGEDDWGSPAALDITKLCVASNQTDAFYVLLGFDDVTLGGANTATACMLMDTDDPENGNADYVLCVTLERDDTDITDPTRVESVELYSCDDTAVDGCPNEFLEKTYSTAEYAFSNNADGPFGNPDSFVELEVPYTDVSIGGGQVLFSSFISYPGKAFLTAARDSIFDDGGQDYTARIVYDLDMGTATTVPVTLSFFRARGGRFTVVEWATSTETGNLGFNLYSIGAERLERLNDDLIPSRVGDSLETQRYRFEGFGSNGAALLLEDVDIEGKSRFHGPFTLGRSYGSEPPTLSPDRQRIQRPQVRSRKLRVQPVRHGRPRQSGLPAVDFLVTDTAVHRVTYEQLLAAGFDFSRAQSQDLALTNRGRPVPLRVESPGLFGPGSYVEFVGERLESLYTDANVYTLRVDRKAARRIELEQTPVRGWSRPAAFYMETRVVETNRAYSFAAPTEDPWYDHRLLATAGPAEVSLEVELDEHLIGAAPVEIELSLWGVTNFPQQPDHHLEVDFNGTRIADTWFDGLVDHPVRAEIPTYLLSPDQNTLRLRLPHDTGAQYDLINYDHYRVTYPRRFVARDGGLIFRAAGDSFRVEGLSSNDALVYRVTEGMPVLLRSIGVSDGPGAGVVVFSGTEELATYYVASGGSLKIPGLREALRPTPVMAGSADLLVVAHPDFVEGLAPLVAARRSQGYSVRVADVEEVYARFASGIFDPEAIRAYVAHAYAEMGTRYVLLVGGDTYDYRDDLELGSVSFVPTLYAQTDSIVRYAPVDALYGDVDRDGLPDLAIGRLPVRTTDELEAVVAKLLEYGQVSHGAAVFASDSLDVAANYSFSEASQAMEALLPSDWLVARVDMDGLGLEGARALLLEEMSLGTDLVSYFGHSGPAVWSFEGLFGAADADLLENSGRPMVVTQWGCWNTYYVSPTSDSLAQRLLLGGDRGAAAVLGAATLTDAENERQLGRFFFQHLADGALLGDAILAAKRDLFASRPEAKDVLLGWTLLGDPLLAVMPQPSGE